MYGFEVEKVQTLNMDGKKKKRGGLLIAKPDYKKAYVTLKSPLSISPDIYPIKIIEEDKQNLIKESKLKTKTKTSFVEEGEVRSHWLEEKEESRAKTERRGRGRTHGVVADSGAKFPWSSMRTSSR